MVKIKAKNETVRNMNLIVPIDGMITIDANGEVEVSDACAENLVTCTNDWVRTDKVATKEAENENGDDNNDEDEKSERELLEERVKKANVKELLEICKEMEFDEDEYGKLSKKNLQKYIMDQYDAIDEVDDDEEEDDDEIDEDEK